MKIDIYKHIDKYLGIPACWILGIISKLRPTPRKEPKSIALLKLWALGDSVVSLPMLRALRNRYPDAKIEVVARKRNEAIYRHNKDINAIVLFEPGNWWIVFKCFRKYDAVIDAEPYLRLSALLSWWLAPRRMGFAHQQRSIIYTDKSDFRHDQHMVNNYLDLIRPLDAAYSSDKLIPVEVAESDENAAETFLKQNKITKKDLLIGLCVGAAESARSRMWPAERFAELADKLAKERKAKILFTGSPNEAELIENVRKQMKQKSINSAGKLSLMAGIALIGKCNVFISNDTGPMHIAAAQGVKTIGLFGPNVPVLWRPYGPGNIDVYHRVWCSPCIINDKGLTPDCLRKENRYECIKLISIDEVYESTLECIGK